MFMFVQLFKRFDSLKIKYEILLQDPMWIRGAMQGKWKTDESNRKKHAEIKNMNFLKIW